MLKELLAEQYSAFLQRFNAQPFRPCRLFIFVASVKDGLTICHASGDTPAEAWSAASTALKPILGGCVWLEFVTACRRVSWTEYLKSLRAEGIRHGIAFDRDWRIAFTAQELNEFLNPHDDEPFQSSELQAYCRRRFGCDLPNVSATDEVEIFDTAKIFFQENAPVPEPNVAPLRIGVLRAKRTEFDSFTAHHRATSGVLIMDLGEKTGSLSASLAIHDNDDIIVITSKGRSIRVPAAEISTLRRQAQGSKVLRLDEGDTVADCSVVRGSESEDENATGDIPFENEDGNYENENS